MSKMLLKYSKLDVNVSLMRIIACFIVIGCHVRLSPIVDNHIDNSLLFIHGFFDDGVAIFFCVTGFFLFNNIIYKNLWKKILKNIIFPTILIEGVSCLLHGFLAGGSLIESLCNPGINLATYLHDILSFKFNSEVYAAHLWYITSYISIIVAFPVLKLIVNEYEKGIKYPLNWVLALGIFNLFAKDLQAVFLFPGGEIETYTVFSVPILLCLLGYVLYKYKQMFYGRKYLGIITLIAMVGINIIRYFLQKNLFDKNINNDYFFYWNTLVALIFSVSFIIFFLSIECKKKHIIVNYIASQTFAIYLLHVLVFYTLDRFGIRNLLLNNLGKGIVKESIYSIVYPLLIFVISLCLVSLFNVIKYIVIDKAKSIKL